MKGKKKSMGMADKPMKEDDWQCRMDLDAVARASAVKKDPERMKKVKAMAKTMMDENKRKKDEAQAMIDMGHGEDAD